jgi:septal ring factor EnvC (AmiA/AmiB activator)
MQRVAYHCTRQKVKQLCGVCAIQCNAGKRLQNRLWIWMSPVRIRSLAPEASALEMPAESGVLELLRANFAHVHDRLDRTETRLGELTIRVAAIERDLAAMKVDYASTQLRLDNMDRRIERIEKRLSLIEA